MYKMKKKLSAKSVLLDLSHQILRHKITELYTINILQYAYFDEPLPVSVKVALSLSLPSF